MRQFSIVAGAGAFFLMTFVTTGRVNSAPAPACANPNALGVSRTVEIDTSGGPGFGLEHYKAYDFLQQKEVVLTFDDGPQKFSTEMVLAALADQCVKATFFSIGKMALGYPEIIRNVAKAGHTIGTHTWSHKAIRDLKTFPEGEDEIERGVSAVKRAVGGPVAPFFRFPTLKDTPEALAHLGKRNIAVFSTDIDSFDFKPQTPEKIVKTVMDKLEKNGKGIVLMHDIHKTTAKALPMLLAELKAKRYRIVHLKPKAPSVTTLAEFDAAIEKDARGLPQAGSEKSVSSVVRTVEGAPAADEVTAEASADDGEDGHGHNAATAAASADRAHAPPQNAVVAAVKDKPVAETASVPPATATAPVPVLVPVLVPVPGPVAAEAESSPVTTGSITPTSAEPGASPVKTVEEGGNVKVDAANEPVAPSFMEKVRGVWELWFGK